MTNPNNNMNAYNQALQINRDLKKENDALKLEIKSLWSDLSEVEKQLAKYLSATEFNEEDTENCEDCFMWLPQCKCKEREFRS